MEGDGWIDLATSRSQFWDGEELQCCTRHGLETQDGRQMRNNSCEAACPLLGMRLLWHEYTRARRHGQAKRKEAHV